MNLFIIFFLVKIVEETFYNIILNLIKEMILDCGFGVNIMQ